MAETILKIAKWKEVFERAESRKIKNLNWVAMPTSFSSNGYQMLLDEFGDEAPAIYGAWCVLVAFAASCTVRGTLSTSRGVAVKVGHIARTTGFQSTVFEKLITWATQEEVSWLIPAQPEEIPQNDGCNDDSGDFPETSGDFPGYKTRPDQTGHNITRQDKTGPAGLPACRSAGDVFESVDPDEIQRNANKLLRQFPSLGADLIWTVASIGTAIDAGFVGDLITRLKSGDIRKPKSYVDRAIQKQCEESGFVWSEMVLAMPPRPGISQKVDA